jgi:hypothetical protein
MAVKEAEAASEEPETRKPESRDVRLQQRSTLHVALQQIFREGNTQPAQPQE